ncbi:MAG: DUF11 domain-containing protein [Planctomycetaceae bacterium]|nr:DUF11 domain-containing protein [Planctomycetaceae bacterium]
MHNSFWKLTSLAAVAGVALFVIVQAQQLIKPQTEPDQASVATDDLREDPTRFEEEDDEASFSNSEIAGRTNRNDSFEPDPFADDRVPAHEPTSNREITSANYGTSQEDLFPDSRDEMISATDRRSPRARPASHRQPTLRLPRQNDADNPFDDGTGSIVDESEDVGPRLSLPGRAGTSRLDDDSVSTVADDDEFGGRSGIRRTSSEEPVESVPSLAMDDSDDPSDFRSGRNREEVSLGDAEELDASALTPRREPAPVRSGRLVGFDDEFETQANTEESSAPRLRDESDGKTEPVELSDDDDAVFSRQGRNRPATDEFDSARELLEPELSEIRRPNSDRDNRIDPEFPEAESPMPDVVSMDDDPALFRNGEPTRTAPRLARDNADLFPDAEMADTPRPKSRPREYEQLERLDEEPSLARNDDVMPLDGKPHLSIQKKSPPSATLGQKMVYEITISNPGNVPARQVVLNDDVPEGVDLDGTVPRAELSGRRLIWRMGTLQPGDQKTVKVRVIPVRVGEVGSVATVNFLSEFDEKRNVPAGFQLDGRRPLPRVPQLEIFLSNLPEEIGIYQKFRVVLTIKNVDRQILNGISLVADLDKGVQHQEVQQQRIECPVDDLRPGQETSIDLDLVGVKAGMVVNRLTLYMNDQPVREAEMNFRILGQ